VNREPLRGVHPHQPLLERYEALRVTPAPTAAPLGRALMMHHGMAAWIQAWASTAPTARPAPPSERAHDVRPGTSPPPPPLPAELERPLVQVLAQMAWDVYRSAAP